MRLAAGGAAAVSLDGSVAPTVKTMLQSALQYCEWNALMRYTVYSSPVSALKMAVTTRDLHLSPSTHSRHRHPRFPRPECLLKQRC